MKKILSTLMIVACLFLAVPAQAQLQFGLKGGLNISKLTFSKDIVKSDNRTGFFIGPMAEFTIPVVGLGVDVAALYNQSGAKAIKTIEVPVNLKWTLGLGSTLGAYVAAGPQFGFNVGSGHFTENFDMKSCNTSFNVGVGLKLLGHLQAGVNYNFGLSKMAKAVDDAMTIEMKRNTWQISVAYMF
mgnify:CR=1 FL=1